MPAPIDRLSAALPDRYRIERELGQGGMAIVFLADDLKHDRKVAIKVLKPELAAVLGAERFLREIRIAANLQSPHILPLLDSGDADGLLYYVMPFVRGESLRDRLARDGVLSPTEAIRLLREVTDGLAHAHRHGVVHRDIKPDNVMLAEGHALLMDFGVAKAIAAGQGEPSGGDPMTLTDVGISIGTPAYMAPEQAAADPSIDARADIYALGVMAYEMLTGEPPFTGTPQAIMTAHVMTPPPPLRDAVPPAIAAIVLKCLGKNPDDRYQSADELLTALDALVTPLGTAKAAGRTPASRRRTTAIVLAAIAAVAAVAFLGIRRIQRRAWVRGTAIPEMRRMIDDGQMDSAWYVGLRARAIMPRDTILAVLFTHLSHGRRPSIVTRPAGAEVYRASLADTSVWHYVGTTPMDSVEIPFQIGLYRFQKPGYRTLYTTGMYFLSPVVLDAVTDPDSEMITIAGGPHYSTFLVGTEGSPELSLGDWKIDRYETTNRQYKAFVEAGGYRDSTWWDYPFQDGNRTLTWSQAMARFIDQTGRPGPSTWVAGDYPSGQADMPVGGVSWYEAAAYAKWAGESLPTVYHWAGAAGIWLSRAIVPLSNMQGTGPWKVGTPRAVSVVGASDMAGNVREWNYNEEASSGERYIEGGGWNDPTYAFVDAYAQPPMDRSAINGIRLARYDPADSNVALARRPIVRAFTDYSKVRSVSDPVFQGYRHQFDYDPRPLEARIERVDSSSDEWIAQFVSFTAAYGDERMEAWIFLPKHGTPPYQPVVFFPGSGAINTRTSATEREMTPSFVVKSGRAFVLPIYKSTYERSDSLTSDIPDKSIFWRDHVIMWGKDFRRTLDYLSSRPDMDSTKFAYFGFSWGGNMGGIVPAIEPRIKVAVLYVAGLTMERPRPEVDPINYLPHIRVPVLMLNGKYDFFFPTETAQRPFYERLGTPPAEKKWVVYEGGHDVPRPKLIAETLAWLDKYLGPASHR